MSWIYKIFPLLVIFGLSVLPARAESLASRLSGRLLLSVEQSGEAWYINPLNLRRYYLGRPADAFRIMRELGLGISEKDFAVLDTASLAGRIVLQVEKNGEAWYINPLDLKAHYLGRPDDAFRIMRELGLGIRIADLALIRRADASGTLNQYSSYRRENIATSAGNFRVDIVTIDLLNPRLKIKTLSAMTLACQRNCLADSVAEFYERGRGFAAINGTYFDTSAEKRNYSFFPLFDSLERVFINEDQLKYWTTGPVMAFDMQNKFYYFKDSREFKSLADFESRYGTLQALIGNKPRLIENYQNFLIEWEVDEKQRTVKALRNAIAYKDNKIYLVVAHAATVPDLGLVMQAMNVEYAVNLDGGGSAALIYDGEYLIGPGRDVVNAIVFSEE
jgi:exopolysaccharide biosynthesis protein